MELDDKGGGFVWIPDILTRPRVKVLKRSGEKLTIEADLFAGGTRRLLGLDGVLKGGAWTGDYSITRDNADEPDAIGTFAATRSGSAPQPQIPGKTVEKAKSPEKPGTVPGDIAGTWEGTYTAFGQDYRLRFVFDGTPPCDFKGSVDMPDEKIRAEIVEACGAGGMATPSATVRAAWEFPGGGGKRSVMQVIFAGTILDGALSGDFIVSKEGSEKALSSGTFSVKRTGGK